MKRELVLSPEYIEFVQTSNKRTQEKLLYAISILETLNPVPTKFVKKLVGTDFYELRVSVDNQFSHEDHIPERFYQKGHKGL